MFVERRKDNYDELQILAGDVRTRRRRANFWTTGLIATTMGATAAYVATTNNQVDSLKSENTTLKIDLGNAERERDSLRVQRDVYLQYTNQFGDMYPELKMADAVSKITVGGPTGSVDWPPLTISNLVWYVDGSRRFPMAAGDVLWIPEGSFWIRLEIPVERREITIHHGPQPSIPSLPGATISSAETTVEGPIDLSGDNFHEMVVQREGSNCVKLELEDTNRDGFGSEYIDMVVTYSNKAAEECGDQ
ncbi:MAG: hypothetical protein HKN43_02435 [Rhodothermales bacterium]|nr:hypothetical protein [Rhodothermales bacterium]